MRVVGPTGRENPSAVARIEAVVHDDVERTVGRVPEHAVDIGADGCFGMVAVNEHEAQLLAAAADVVDQRGKCILGVADDELDVGVVRPVLLAEDRIDVEALDLARGPRQDVEAAPAKGPDLDGDLGTNLSEQAGQGRPLGVCHRPPVVLVEPRFDSLR